MSTAAPTRPHHDAAPRLVVLERQERRDPRRAGIGFVDHARVEAQHEGQEGALQRGDQHVGDAEPVRGWAARSRRWADDRPPEEHRRREERQGPL
jgi:hypothetical protein